MIPYFAKYLPVEGEIKEGDKFLLNYEHSQGRLRTCHYIMKDMDVWSEENQSWSDKQDALYIDAKESKGWGFVFRNEAKLAKLFLCLRDIQVGDTYKVETDGLGTVEEFIYNGEEGQIDGNCFKVIGEISPDATWVKEEDEFSEEEVEIDFYSGQVDDDPMWTFVGNKRESINRCLKDKKFVVIARLKGPCGHFH